MQLSNFAMCVSMGRCPHPADESTQKSNDIEGSFKTLIGWVVTLKQELMKEATGDEKEAERRTNLKWFALSLAILPVDSISRRSLEDVEKRSRSLLGKKWPARFLDAPRDSAILVEFVEDIRKAILIYSVGTKSSRGQPPLTHSRQASQQQSTLQRIIRLTVRFFLVSVALHSQAPKSSFDAFVDEVKITPSHASTP